MNRTAYVISLFAALLTGAALGLMGGIMFAHHVHGRAIAAEAAARAVPGMPPMPGGPGGFPGHGGPGAGPGRMDLRDAMPRLQKLLGLSPEQVKRIEPHVLATRKMVDAARESLHVSIDRELTPAQRERWREFRRTHPFPGGPPRDHDDPTHRANPGDEGESR